MLTLALATICLGSARPAAPPVMRIHCIDVRQASAALFEFKCGAILIDGGADSPGHAATVANYLDTFFQGRPDLDKTLKAVFLTHCHVDHTAGLPKVFDRFKVERLITNGPYAPKASGARDMNKVFDFIRTHPTHVREVLDDEVVAKLPRGVTDVDIDPLSCSDCDPKIRVLSGGLLSDPGWGNEFGKPRWQNENNNSLVIRIDFKKSSVLVTGDLQDVAIKRLITQYTGSKMLDSDVYFAGHHGARNGTTKEFVQAMSPKLAFVSCGHHDDGVGKQFTTWAYGHPNKDALDTLQAGIKELRDQPIKTWVGLKGKEFTKKTYKVTSAVYCTAWDGNLVFETDGTGTPKRVP